MSELKEFYVKKMGHDYTRIENASWYLAELSLRAAVDIDNHLTKKASDFSNVQELAEILKKYQLKDTDGPLAMFCFPYLPFWRAVKKGSEKELRWVSELALEMRLLRYEIDDIPINYEMLEELRSLLCNLSKEFSVDQCYQDHPYRMTMLPAGVTA